MKKRSLITILVITFGLFVSSAVISQSSSSSEQASAACTGNGGGGGLVGNSCGDVNGVYVPD
ncbi:MAG TPA: hypothetical protein P5514_03960 [Bacteroidales bacterium]|nr:hypothetical protein [Bacteroidales bacterium]HRX96072.1 hypothetical protein [Bacteroidales bacterium]